MSKLKTLIKYGAVAGASFGIGYTVGVADNNPTDNAPEPTHRTMEYDVERAYELLDDMDTRVSVLQEHGLDHEIEHLKSAAKKLERGVKHAEMEGNEKVNVPINAEEFAAWIISVLGDNTGNHGTGRQHGQEDN